MPGFAPLSIMPHFLKLTLPLVGLLMAAQAPARAQISNVSDSLRRSGELVGSRPSAGRPASAPRTVGALTPTARLLGADLNLARTRADELPGLYEHFIGVCQEQRRQWSEDDWSAAAAVLARLNQRYEQVRTTLSINDRLNVRSIQAEFHTLYGARQLKERLAN